MEPNTENYTLDYPPCIYNKGVQCNPNNRHCQACGWDPDVAQERLEKFISGIKKKTTPK